MHFMNHSKLKGLHAFLSPSKYHWVNYSDDKMDRVYYTALAAQRGTELHDFAAEAIRLGVKLAANGQTVNTYVNDAIGYKMTPEQILYYSDNCFGSADSISFRRNFLRIHDLKTGDTRVSFKQLEVYTALFCLEYNFKPMDIKMELRIYQGDQIFIHEPEPDDIMHIMDKIITFDKRIDLIKAEGMQ